LIVPSEFTVPEWQVVQLVEVEAWDGGGAPWQASQASGPPVHEGVAIFPPALSVAPWQ
jgi:hypothetical protein